jgi:signal peptidase I
MAGTKGTRRRVGRIATGAAFAFALTAAVLVLVPALLGWQRYAIVSGSMTPAYDKGSLVLDEVVPVRELRVGDVITYLPPRGDHLITHRISWIGRDATGARSGPRATRIRSPTAGRSGSTVRRRRAYGSACRTRATR